MEVTDGVFVEDPFQDVVVALALAQEPVEFPLQPVAPANLLVGTRHRYVDVRVDTPSLFSR